MNELNKIKSTPIKIPKWVANFRYFENRFEVNNKLKKRKLDTKHKLYKEKLVDCQKLGLMGESYYYNFRNKKPFNKFKKYLKKNIYLRKSVAEDLKKVDDYLRQFGLALYLKSGYRNYYIQLSAIEFYTKKGGESQKQLFAQPEERSKTHPFPHSTGGAIDLTLYNLKKKDFVNLRFRKDITIFGIEKVKKLTKQEKEILEYRRILYNVLCAPIVLSKDKLFVAHPFEYWHFSRGDQLARYFSNSKKLAYYGEIKKF